MSPQARTRHGLGGVAGRASELSSPSPRRTGQDLQRVRHEQPRGAGHLATHEVLEDVPGRLGVHRRERVVEKIHVRAPVRGARERHALPLAPGEVHPILANLSLVPCHLRVGGGRAQRAGAGVTTQRNEGG